MEPPEDDSEARFSVPRDFEENLAAVLGVDPEELDGSEEEPEQEA